jgi:hypothetical protein
MDLKDVLDESGARKLKDLELGARLAFAHCLWLSRSTSIECCLSTLQHNIQKEFPRRIYKLQ